MILEIELKLKIAPQDVDLIAKHPLLAPYQNTTPWKNFLATTYFDTQHCILNQNGFALRIREGENKIIQTVKDAGKRSGDLHQRHEWNHEVARPRPDLEQLADQALRIRLTQLIGQQPLLPLFKTEFVRTSWELVHEGTTIELAVDQGIIQAGTHQEAINEVELELIKGDAQQLYVVADALKKTIPLSVEDASKAERGYKLYLKNLTQ